jgi:hypothetical protein
MREWKTGKVYPVKDRWFGKPVAHILVTRKFRQRLGDISREDVEKEGYRSLEEFKQAWEGIHGRGSWDPKLIVTAYEFKIANKGESHSSIRVEAGDRLAGTEPQKETIKSHEEGKERNGIRA